MFWFFKRRPVSDFWSVFDNRAQVGDPAGLVGWVEASDRQEALRKARILMPRLSVHVSRISRRQVAEVEVLAGRPVDFRRLVEVRP